VRARYIGDMCDIVDTGATRTWTREPFLLPVLPELPSIKRASPCFRLAKHQANFGNLQAESEQCPKRGHHGAAPGQCQLDL